MKFKYITVIVLLFTMLALARGFVVHYHDLISFGSQTALAAGDGGSGGGDGGDGPSGGGDGGDGPSGGGDGGDGPSGGGGGDGPSDPAPVLGCTDKKATNYNSVATKDDGSCVYPVYGCMDPKATNYNPAATSQTGYTCTYPPAPIYGCMDPKATNYNPKATSQTGYICTYPPAPIYGCMDPKATNYNPAATSQTGYTCTYPAPIYGCMDPKATNYNPKATSQTGYTCTYPPAIVYGCMDPKATNYNPKATSQTGYICTYPPTPGIPSCVLTASSTSVTIGDRTNLTWTTVNGSTFSIDNAIGAVTPAVGGTVSTKAINVDTTFTGTVVSPTGSTATCTVKVTVTGGGGDGGPACVLTISPASYVAGASATLTWGGTGIQSVFIDNGVGTTSATSGSLTISPVDTKTYTYTGTFKATNGQTLTCSAPLSVSPGGGGGGGGGCTSNCGGGGGGGTPLPTITLAALPHVGVQQLAYLYLSQIPQTGLALGPLGMTLYWVALLAWALAAAYLVLFGAVPFAQQRLRTFGAQIQSVLNAQPILVEASVHQSAPIATAQTEATPEAPRSYSNYEGFKSFARDRALSIDDIVKGLSRQHIEPIYENVEPIATQTPLPAPTQPATPAQLPTSMPITTPISVRGFAIALIEGNREAVFAGLRQEITGGGSAEKLITATVCLFDDAYRARIDGVPVAPDIQQITARLTTPVLEKLIASLTIAIDSSYSTGVTGAKLALTRALATLGA